jgi:hypothetical protein
MSNTTGDHSSQPSKESEFGVNMITMITEDTPLLAPPRARAEQARAYIIALGSVYTPADLDTIIGHYWRYSIPVGLDPLLAISQCIHETSELNPDTGKWQPLSSWWARRPRRNPAGLGVTGKVQTRAPSNMTDWQHDTDSNPAVWRAGLAFPSWEVSARAHIGRVLAYAVPIGAEDTQQKNMILYALGWRTLDPRLRGTAPTLKLLGAKHNLTGNGWASPGEKYGAKIAQIAEVIRTFPA